MSNNVLDNRPNMAEVWSVYDRLAAMPEHLMKAQLAHEGAEAEQHLRGAKLCGNRAEEHKASATIIALVAASSLIGLHKDQRLLREMVATMISEAE